ncbi:MAG: glycosyltransferase family 39 protein [Anaerolineales bacterium]|nr:MAG: glycosyltransferase family 39 protein [Anaerolineales bacterium]
MKNSFPVRIYCAALVLRLIPVLLTRGLGIGLDDMFQYDMLARSLASGNGFRWYAQEDLKLLEPYVDFDLSTAKEYDPQYGLYTSFRAPLYPTFLAIVYFFSGLDVSRFFAVRLAQAVFLGAPLAPLTYLVSRRLFSDSEKTAKISAWIVACYPMLLVYPLGLGTENLFFVLFLASFLFLLKSIESPSPVHFLLSGLLLALATLTRSVILPFAGLAILYLYYLHRRRALLSAFAFVLVIAPWILRNSLLHNKLTGIETSMGYNLYLGYHPEGNGSFVFGPSLDLLTIMDDAERDKVGTQKALGFITAQAERLIPLAVSRLGLFFGLEKRVLMYFYSNNLIGFIPKPALLTISVVLLLPFVLVSTSAVFGSSFLRRNPQTILLILLLFCYVLPHVLILSEDRFHLALIPFFAILAAHCWSGGTQALSARWHESGTGKLAVSLALFALVLLLFNWGFELHRDADKITALLGLDGNKTYFPY